MRILLVAVGKLRPALREVADDYLRRVTRSLALDEREVREAGRQPAGVQRQDEEDRRILRLIPAGMPVTLLDPGGTPLTSEEVAARIAAWRLAAQDRAIVIGGANGVGAALHHRADERWSLGPITLPHELARVVVLEQLYRGTTILQGTPYHRGDA
ncbi:MAG TPA: 23S rRNA (pseudouridine(1915)-N(3))-methyltransferase RlmH [Gemmatimonadales bacterium]|nr:23S rRNA (pseudouridine(1915)-N(3))-methyltransferase RlmH [Gemmatimonadales bacterium]